MVLCAVSNKVLVCRNLSSYITVVHILVGLCIIINVEIFKCCSCSVFLNASYPAKELVSCASRGCRNRYCLIDLDVLALINQSSIIVVIPIDEGQRLFVLFNIDRLQHYGVCVITIGIKLVRINNAIIVIIVSDPRVFCKHIECAAREYFYA